MEIQVHVKYGSIMSKEKRLHGSLTELDEPMEDLGISLEELKKMSTGVNFRRKLCPLVSGVLRKSWSDGRKARRKNKKFFKVNKPC